MNLSGVKPQKVEENLKSHAASLQKEIDGLKETQKDMTSTLEQFDKKYASILQNIKGFKRNMEEQDALMKDIMQFVSKKSMKKKPPLFHVELDLPFLFLYTKNQR